MAPGSGTAFWSLVLSEGSAPPWPRCAGMQQVCESAPGLPRSGPAPTWAPTRGCGRLVGTTATE